MERGSDTRRQRREWPVTRPERSHKHKPHIGQVGCKKAPSIDLSLNKKVITICKTRLAVPSSIYKLWFICTKPQYKQERNTRTENLSTKKLHLHSLSPAVVHVCMTERTCRFFAAPYDLITLRQMNRGYLK